MKRFFCTKCERVRRVRKLPLQVTTNMVAGAGIVERIGECDWHTLGRMRIARVKVEKPQPVKAVKTTNNRKRA